MNKNENDGFLDWITQKIVHFYWFSSSSELVSIIMCDTVDSTI